MAESLPLEGSDLQLVLLVIQTDIFASQVIRVHPNGPNRVYPFLMPLLAFAHCYSSAKCVSKEALARTWHTRELETHPNIGILSGLCGMDNSLKAGKGEKMENRMENRSEIDGGKNGRRPPDYSSNLCPPKI